MQCNVSCRRKGRGWWSKSSPPGAKFRCGYHWRGCRGGLSSQSSGTRVRVNLGRGKHFFAKLFRVAVSYYWVKAISLGGWKTVYRFFQSANFGVCNAYPQTWHLKNAFSTPGLLNAWQVSRVKKTRSVIVLIALERFQESVWSPNFQVLPAWALPAEDSNISRIVTKYFTRRLWYKGQKQKWLHP